MQRLKKRPKRWSSWAALTAILLIAGAAQREAVAATAQGEGTRPQQAKAAKGSKGQQEESLIEQHLTHSAEFDWAVPADGQCPSWLADYAAFHRATRGTKQAKYLVNSCHKGNECHFGLGDRMRGLLATVQIAIAHKRVLLVDWASPTPLEHFFQPAQVNWSLTPDLGLDLQHAAHIDDIDRDNFTANVPTKDVGNHVWAVSTNSLPFYHVPEGVPTFRRVSWDSHCLLTALFQPSPALLEATNAEQLKLLGSLDRPYVAVHLRMGHLEGEQQDITRGWDHVHGLLAAYQCAARRNYLIHALLLSNTTNSSSSPSPSTADSLLRHSRRRRHLLVDPQTGGPQLTMRPRREQREVDGSGSSNSQPHRRHLQVVVKGEEAAGSRKRQEQEVVPSLVGPLSNGPHHHRHPHVQHSGDLAAAGHKMLLLTDHSQLRTAAAHGVLAGVTGPDYLAYHISRYHGDSHASTEDHERVSMTVYVDLMLLARSTCLVWARSGFPMVAMTLGFNPCTVDVDICIKEEDPAHNLHRHQHHHHSLY